MFAHITLLNRINRVAITGLTGLVIGTAAIAPMTAAAAPSDTMTFPEIQLMGLDAARRPAEVAFVIENGVLISDRAALTLPSGDQESIDPTPLADNEALTTLDPATPLAEGLAGITTDRPADAGDTINQAQTYTIGTAATGGKIFHLHGLRGEPFEQVVQRYGGSRWIFLNDGNFVLIPADGGPRLVGGWVYRKNQGTIEVRAGTSIQSNDGRYSAVMFGVINLKTVTAKVVHRTELARPAHPLYSVADFSMQIY